MRVVFLQDVPSVARAGEIKEVTNGYGRNFLIPRKLALLARPEAINTLETQLAVKARTQAQTEAELLELASHLDGREVVLEARAGSIDRLYGSVRRPVQQGQPADGCGQGAGGRGQAGGRAGEAGRRRRGVHPPGG